jgi:hypothetical protein
LVPGTKCVTCGKPHKVAGECLGAGVGAKICDDRGAAGFSWVMDDAMMRTSHALADDARVWLVDPTDEPVALARAAELGTIGGVVQLLDRHGRDCAALAERFGVPLHRCPLDPIQGAPFTFIRLTWVPWWREVALWWAQPQLLVVPEAVGANPFFTAGRASVGVHPMLRLTPPRRLLALAPRVLLTGHGPGVIGDDAAPALHTAIRDARHGIPALLGTLVRSRRSRG